MKSILIIIVLSFSLFAQETIKLKNTNENKIQFKKMFNLIDEENGFYDEVISSVGADGRFYVFDRGNSQCSQFDKDGKFIRYIGKSGNGPGEFNAYVQKIEASKDVIFFLNFGRQVYSFYNTDGTFIKDVPIPVKANPFINDIIFTKNKVNLYFPKAHQSRVYKLSYSLAGELLEEKENENYQIQRSKTPNLSDVKAGFIKFNDGFLRTYLGPFKLDFVNLNRVQSKILEYDFTRIKIVDLFDLNTRQNRTWFNSLKKDDKRRQFVMKSLEETSRKFNGYLHDIISLLGASENYAYLRLQNESKNSLKIAILSKDFKIVQITELSCDEITSTNVSNGVLLVNQTNDEVGPFTDVYKLNLN